jgi:hypothetical protein
VKRKLQPKIRTNLKSACCNSIGKIEEWSTSHGELERGITALLASCERLRVRAHKDLHLLDEAAQLCTVLLQDVLKAAYAKAQELIMLPKDSAHPSMPAGLVQAIFKVPSAARTHPWEGQNPWSLRTCQTKETKVCYGLKR